MRTWPMRAPGGRAARKLTEHLLVATEAADDGSPAVRVAAAIAGRDRSTVDVLSVVVPNLPSPLLTGIGLAPVYPVAPLPPDLEGRRRRVRAELARAGRQDWRETVVAGWPGSEIPAIAKQLGATLIVMGIGRHSPIDRLMGSETALQILQVADVPILAVSPDCTGIPRHALAALDFSPQSETAARVAAQLVGMDGALSLAHVRIPWTEVVDREFAVDLYAAGLEQRFEVLKDRLVLGALAPRTLRHVVRHGDPTHELLDLARETEADLLAVGAQNHDRLHRIFLGSVAAKLLRSARCSVLVIASGAEQARTEARSGATSETRRAHAVP